jgi:hypothetical protein
MYAPHVYTLADKLDAHFDAAVIGVAFNQLAAALQQVNHGPVCALDVAVEEANLLLLRFRN